MILLAYGALWLSTRGQHPDSGPSAAAFVLVYVAASKLDWAQFCATLPVILGGTAALFVGPSGAWLLGGL